MLNEAKASHGQKVTLLLDVPNYLDTLYAACVSADGKYRVTPFPVGQKEVSFPQAAASRTTRAEVALPRVTSEGRNSDNVNMLLKPNKSTNWNSNATREDPHGIIIPCDFRYPREYKCIKWPYAEFSKWGAKKVDETDWYLYPDLNLVYTKSVFTEE